MKPRSIVAESLAAAMLLMLSATAPAAVVTSTHESPGSLHGG